MIQFLETQQKANISTKKSKRNKQISLSKESEKPGKNFWQEQETDQDLEESVTPLAKGNFNLSANIPKAGSSCCEFDDTNDDVFLNEEQFDRFSKEAKISANKTANCSCEECLRQRLQQASVIEQHPPPVANLQPSGRGNPGVAPNSVVTALAGVSSATSSAACSSCASSTGGLTIYCNGAMPPQTIEEQIKILDRIVKECDNSRKCLDQINRRVDDLTDEIRRYREFLGHEKSRRDPALYKATPPELFSAYNESICGLIGSLTSQLTMEWSEKLDNIQNQTLAKFLKEKG